ncbi:MAG: PA0069 family radical SAM protein [Nibricoccus sp.]
MMAIGVQMNTKTSDQFSAAFRGRGSTINPSGRFERIKVEPDPDASLNPEDLPAPRTQFFEDSAESIITHNDSPDVGFETSINVYRGCEHGCAYCFARPFHEYLGFSAGLDFETKIFVKTRAPILLRQELSSRKWKPQVLVMSGVTDCYQPAERHFCLTRQCLEVLDNFKNPVAIITKNALVSRDIDLLASLAAANAANVTISVTTLNSELAHKMEPRASLPNLRLETIRRLSAAGIPVSVLAAPMIPGLTDHELPSILEAAREAGATRAGYVLLRLPHGVKDIFCAWLDEHEPTKKDRVLARVRAMRDGALYNSNWGERMRGSGLFADQMARMFEVTARRLGFQTNRHELSTDAFMPPGDRQLEFL